VDDHQWLAERFEAHRGQLRAVAYRMLGSLSEADDALQESWLRLSRSSTSDVQNLGGWMTTIVARVCLDLLRARKSRREEPLDEPPPDAVADRAGGIDPEQEALMADSVGLALLVVLETLSPAERLAFVLHDLFAVPFDEIAPILDRSPDAAKMLASRARRRVQQREVSDAGPGRQRAVVDAFLAASRNGDFEALVAMLDPDVVMRSDRAGVLMGASALVRGSADVAEQFSGRARVTRPAIVNGSPGVVWAPGGRPRVAFGFTVRGGRIVAIDLLADPERLREVELADSD
jgi:RNA polymerase sigma factor (sigma-70 family)